MDSQSFGDTEFFLGLTAVCELLHQKEPLFSFIHSFKVMGYIIRGKHVLGVADTLQQQ